MALIYSPDLATALADAVIAQVDAGSSNGYINVYTGTLPTDLDPTGDTLLAEFVLADPAAAAAVAGVSTFDFDPDLTDIALASGTAGYFIVFDSDDNPVFGGTVDTAGGDINFSAVIWVLGGEVRLTSGTFTQPTE